MKGKQKKVKKVQEQVNDGQISKVETIAFKKWLEMALPSVLELILIDFVKVTIKMENAGAHLPNGVIFSIDHAREYHRATISVYPEAILMWREEEFEELVACLVHELSHMNVGQLAALAQARYATKEEIRESVESLTETIARYIMRDKDRMAGLYQNLIVGSNSIKL